MKYLALLSLLLLPACAAFDSRWEVDMPGFQMKRLEWHVLATPTQVAARCGLDYPRTACVIRIREGGQCLVYSIYSEEQAKTILGRDRLTIWQHEVHTPDGKAGHCAGMTHDGARP